MEIVLCGGAGVGVGVVVCVGVGVGAGSPFSISLPYRLAGCHVREGNVGW